jgi:hypothetical protein
VLACVLMSMLMCVFTPALRGQASPRDSTGVLTGKIVERQTDQPVPYGTVQLVGTARARFADSAGVFTLTRLAPGSYHLRVRQIGYSPADTTVTVGAGPGATAVTLHMTKIALTLAAIQVEGRRTKGCVATGVPDSTVNAGLATIFAQVRENVDRFRLVLEEYPFHYELEERTILRSEPGGDSTERTDTASYESRDRRQYQIGHVVYDEAVPLAGTRRMMYLPTFRDLADPAFLSAHCFTFGGAQKLDSKSGARVLRVDFRPAASIASPDVEGSVFLDADRYIVRRAVFRLTKPETLDPPLIGVTVTSTYRELLPLVPVLDAFRTELPLPPASSNMFGSLRSVDRTEITEYHLTGYAFESRTPGDQPASGGTEGAVIAASPAPAPAAGNQQTASIEGRVLRADGTPVVGAAVGVLGSTDSTATSDSGRFVIRNLAPGAHMVWLRGVGFLPQRIAVTARAGPPRAMNVTVTQFVPVLAKVVTTARFPAGYSAVGLDKRIESGVGQVMTYDQILHRRAVTLSQLLQGMAGIKMWQNSHGFGTTTEGTRGPGSCVSYVVDGVPQTQMMDRTNEAKEESVGPESPDHLIDPASVGAIEVYSSAERPAGLGTLEEHPPRSPGDGQIQIDLNAQQCALVVIWTRARLGLTSTDSAAVVNAMNAPSVRAAAPAAPALPKTVVSAVFPTAGPGASAACHPPAPMDSVDVNTYAILESSLASNGRDSAWSRYSDEVLAAFRRSFALPSPLPLPVFGYAHPALAPGSLKPKGLATTPTLSSTISFTLDQAGALTDPRVAASSLSGDADTSILAAVQAAGAGHAFPMMPAISGRPPSVRFDLTVTTTTPDPVARSIVTDRVEVPEWLLSQQAALIRESYVDPTASVTTPGAAPDTALFELVVDENGRAIVPSIRAVSRSAGRVTDPDYRAFVSRVAHRLPSFVFDPAMIGSCPVRQIILQPVADR